ncbi:hypothetical protein BDV24DRAFT_15563 [Aspergillus arachidicola]|uniref:Uncharacterized protein n=1 Tax=Aspergillus arachidicola TaxID=656916 RepID=A0A5N6XRG6_9EURO|nr:hypothetical protein BDV24DRAFT_15563 [Aspergillus arachidicola]
MFGSGVTNQGDRLPQIPISWRGHDLQTSLPLVLALSLSHSNLLPVIAYCDPPGRSTVD